MACQDLLTAVDACEELLQEVDITSFLLALCGHTWVLPHSPPSPGPLSPGPFSSSIEEGPEPRERAILVSESRLALFLRVVKQGCRRYIDQVPTSKTFQSREVHLRNRCLVTGFIFSEALSHLREALATVSLSGMPHLLKLTYGVLIS